MMRRPRPQPIRNKLDLADSRQVRSMKRRLRLSEDQLNEIVGRIGNSIAAISKEVALMKAKRRRPTNVVPEAAVMVAAAAAEPSIVGSKGDGEAVPPFAT
jgi:hypothetical protein